VEEEKKQWSKTASRSLALQAGHYNHAFWEHYNVIKTNALDSTVQSLFERNEKLDEQFKADKTQRKN
jgi:hypothetical protein